MASKAEDSGSTTVEDDLIHCPICFDMFDNPRSMPCLHTYCYKCLDRLCRDKNPRGDSVDCPICGKECNIPSEGVAGFAHNFFIQRMVNDNRRNAPQKGVASRYCIEHANQMHQLYCFNCTRNVCVCCVIFDERHSGHKLQKIEKVATNFRSQMSADVVAVKKLLHETERRDQRQKSAWKEFSDRLTSVVSQVDKQCRDILSYFKTVVNKEKQKILQELKLAEERALRVFSEYEEQSRLSVDSLTSFINYSEDLRKKGNSYDITRAGNDLHKWASRILTEHPVSKTDKAPAVEFRAENVSKILACVVESGIVGRLVETDDDGAEDTGFMNRAWRLKPQTSAAQPAAPAAVSAMQHNDDSSRSSVSMTCADAHVIAPREDRKGNVRGLTVHGDELFIVRFEPKGHIEVYSASSFTFKHNIKVKELERSEWCEGLTSCDSNNCLYVSYLHDSVDDDWYIARMELTGDNNVLEWKVKKYHWPVGLSVNSEHNLIVACDLPSDKLIEYTTRGELVREILLRGDITNLCHALQLNRFQFLVSHGDDDDFLHRVCVVDVNGRTLVSYGKKRGAESEQLNYPRQLAVDRNGFIFFADCNNNRIVVLDSKLKWSHDLKIDGGSVVKKPYSLYLDENRNLLLVGEGDGDASRVVIVTV